MGACDGHDLGPDEARVRIGSSEAQAATSESLRRFAKSMPPLEDASPSCPVRRCIAMLAAATVSARSTQRGRS